MEFRTDYENITNIIVKWLKDYHEKTGMEFVVGLSGGIDSAVVAALCVRAIGKDKVRGIVMPCKSNPDDAYCAGQVVESLGIDFAVVDLENTLDTLVEAMGANDITPLNLGNTKARLRMTTLYAYASQFNSLVVGTDNLTESILGYFTKYGDGGVDLLPISELVKTEVRGLAKYLGVPQDIINRPPSAGLWEGQTDEGELGMTYEEIDKSILSGDYNEVVKKHYEATHHKRELPPVCDLGER